jgi:hypothetical protein
VKSGATERIWTKVQNLTTDPANNNIYSKSTHFNWQYLRGHLLDEQPSILDYFRLFYPEDTNIILLEKTNAELSKEGLAELSLGEWYKYIGIRLTMAVEHRRGEIKHYWDVHTGDCSVKTAADYGNRFKMTHQRFEKINSSFRFAEANVVITPSTVSVLKLHYCLSKLILFHWIFT